MDKQQIIQNNTLWWAISGPAHLGARKQVLKWVSLELYSACVLQLIWLLPKIRVWRNFHENVGGGQKKDSHEYGEESHGSDHAGRMKTTKEKLLVRPSPQNGSALRECGEDGGQNQEGRVGNIKFETDILKVLRGVFLLTWLSANSPNLGRFVKLYFSSFFSLSRFIPTFSDFDWRLRLGGRAVRVVRKKPEATKTLFLRSEKLIGGGKTRWSKHTGEKKY